MDENMNQDKEKWLRDFLERDKSMDWNVLRKELRESGNEDLQEEFRRMRLLENVEVDEEKIWKQIRAKMERGRKKRLKVWHYAAMFLLPLLVVGMLWLAVDGKKGGEMVPVTRVAALTPGGHQAYLLRSSGNV